MKKTITVGVLMAVSAVVFLRWGPVASDGRGEDPAKGSDSLPGTVQSAVSRLAGPSSAGSRTNQTATVRGTKPYVLAGPRKFDEILRRAVEASGARVVGIRSQKALLIEADDATVARLAADARFSGVEECAPARKISAGLSAAIARGAETVEVGILTLSDADRPIVQERIIARGGEILTGCLNDGDTFRARISADCVTELAACGDVRWLEKFSRPKFLNAAAVRPAAMNVSPAWELHGLSGEGQVVSTSDTGIDTGDVKTMHADLRKQVKAVAVADGAVSYDNVGHGTHTAGSIAGDGTMSDGRIRGVAWGAKLYVWFCSDPATEVITPESMGELFQKGGEWSDAYIHSASWGNSDELELGKYVTQCKEMDMFVWKNPTFLPVFAAGNEGKEGPRTINTPATAKNVLSVGATENAPKTDDELGGWLGADVWPTGDPERVAEYSSRGPCLDGRIKPDVAAPGTCILSTRAKDCSYKYGTHDDSYAFSCGTSMACPLVAGAVALVREWLVERCGFTNELPTAALMKAVVAGGAKGVAAPDNETGWGRVDLEETLFPSNRAVKLVDRIPFEQGSRLSWVVETTNAAPLEVQLAWIDYPGSPDADPGEPCLVNDLDLTVEPVVDGGRILFGNGGDAPDSVNNLESVRIGTAKPGRYVITVDCKDVPYGHAEGGAAALYVRGAFDPESTPEVPSRARIRETGVGYPSLEEALGAVQAGQTVEILGSATLRRSVRIGTNCTIAPTNGATAAATVWAAGAVTVGQGARVLFDNVVFSSADGSSVTVEEGGTAAFSGYTAFDRVVVADDRGFELAGQISRSVLVDTPNSGAGETFGYAAHLDASLSAAFVGSAANDRLGGERFVEGGGWKLRWSEDAPVPDAAAVARNESVPDANKRNFRSLDKLFESLKNNDRIVICKDCTIHKPIRLGSQEVRIRAEPERRTLTVSCPDAEAAAFVVGMFSRLFVSNLTVTGATLCGAFDVNGENARLILSAGTEIRGCAATNESFAGGVTVRNGGTVSMSEGCEIRACRTVSCGGGVRIGGRGVFEFLGGGICGCRAEEGGGGMFVDSSGALRLQGAVTFLDNAAGPVTAEKRDDVLLADETCDFGIEAGFRAEDRSICVGYLAEGDRWGNETGKSFAGVGSDVDAAQAARAFACNGRSAASAVPSADGRTLVWRKYGARACAPEEASVAVYPADEEMTYCYRTVDDANGEVDGSATFELLRETCVCKSDFVVRNGAKVVLRSRAGMPCRLRCDRNSFFDVRSEAGLSISNLHLVCGSGVPGVPRVAQLVTVDGLLRLANGAKVDGAGEAGGGVVGIRMHSGAHLVMESGSCITNFLCAESSGGGGLCNFGASIELKGGCIVDCQAQRGGGAFLQSESFRDEPRRTFVSGDVRIEGNRKSDLERALGANVCVVRRDTLVLAGNFTGCIWLDGPSTGPDEVKTAFGLVDADYFRTGRGDALVGGARNFRHEADDDFGCIATNGAGDAILVWNNALETDAATGLRFCEVEYEVEPEDSWEDPEEDPEKVSVRYFEFTGASPKPVFVEPGPIAFQSIERQDDDWVLVATNARRWCWYSLWSGTTPETNGFELVEGSSNQWMSADGPITNRVPVRESESSRFWLLRGAPGCAPSITED